MTLPQQNTASARPTSFYYLMCQLDRVQYRSKEQHLDRQLAALKGVDKLFSDKLSGANTKRPELQKMLGYIREGDNVLTDQNPVGCLFVLPGSLWKPWSTGGSLQDAWEAGNQLSSTPTRLLCSLSCWGFLLSLDSALLGQILTVKFCQVNSLSNEQMGAGFVMVLTT